MQADASDRIALLYTFDCQEKNMPQLVLPLRLGAQHESGGTADPILILSRQAASLEEAWDNKDLLAPQILEYCNSHI